MAGAKKSPKIVGSLRFKAEKAKALAYLRDAEVCGTTVREAAEALGIGDKSVRAFCQQHGIKLRTPAPNTDALIAARKAAAKKPKPPRRKSTGITSVEEWIAKRGPVVRYGPGTVQMMIEDALHLAGKKLKFSYGQGTGQKPYSIYGKPRSRREAIEIANRILAKHGKPLISTPWKDAAPGEAAMTRSLRLPGEKKRRAA